MLRVKLASSSKSRCHGQVTNDLVFVNAVLGTHVIETMQPRHVTRKTANVFAVPLVSHLKVVQLTNYAILIRQMVNIVTAEIRIQWDVKGTLREKSIATLKTIKTLKTINVYQVQECFSNNSKIDVTLHISYCLNHIKSYS